MADQVNQDYLDGETAGIEYGLANKTYYISWNKREDLFFSLGKTNQDWKCGFHDGLNSLKSLFSSGNDPYTIAASEGRLGEYRNENGYNEVYDEEEDYDDEDTYL